VIVVAAAIAAGCGQYGERYEGGDASNEPGAGSTTAISKAKFDAKARKAAGCTEIKKVKEEGRAEHVEGDIDYEADVPSSGEHNPVPLDWGIYAEDQPTEKWVHNLEHGHLVVAYKGLSKDEYEDLRGHVKRDDWHIVLLPRKANPKDGVYYVAWGAEVYCKEPSAAALQEMANVYRDQGPELVMRDTQKADED
jgi:hypothetical protein